jgi:hypothetical protein
MDNNLLNQLKSELYKLLEVQQATSVALLEHYFEKLKQIKEEEPKIVLSDEEEEEEPKPNKRSLPSSEEDESFVANDDEEISSYSSEEMEEMVAKHNETMIKNPKRLVKKSKPFILQKFKDEDEKDGIECGGNEYDKHDIKELKSLMEQPWTLNSNPWWNKQFGNVIEGVINNCGKNKDLAEAFYTNVIFNLFLCNKDNVRVEVSKFDRPACICSLCGLKRTCHYDYLVDDNKERPIGNDCYKVADCLVQMLVTLKNKKKQSAEQVMEKLMELRDTLLESHAGKSRNKY